MLLVTFVVILSVIILIPTGITIMNTKIRTVTTKIVKFQLE